MSPLDGVIDTARIGRRVGKACRTEVDVDYGWLEGLLPPVRRFREFAGAAMDVIRAGGLDADGGVADRARHCRRLRNWKYRRNPDAVRSR
jgi:hypothetical protein